MGAVPSLLKRVLKEVLGEAASQLKHQELLSFRSKRAPFPIILLSIFSKFRFTFSRKGPLQQLALRVAASAPVACALNGARRPAYVEDFGSVEPELDSFFLLRFAFVFFSSFLLLLP